MPEAAGKVKRERFVSVGQVRNQPTSLVILAVQGDTLCGSVLSERGDNYEIRPLGRGVHVVRQLDPTTRLHLACALINVLVLRGPLLRLA